ncbi:MAG TPA: preprotein translocase subunit SecE [Solirubrobacteraceae bacterium]|nr:preprotein translocase subunit SecE [Solirubrobacteraceae bacterium]
MARDRKRAKQRRQRRAPGSRHSSATQPTRSDVPGALDHASGEADEFEAAIVAGADGVPAGENGDAPAAPPRPVGDGEVDTEHLSEEEVEEEALAEGDIGEDELQEPVGSTARKSPGGGGSRGGVTPEQASGAPVRGENRVVGFLRASWAELQRVQWPDRRQVTQATAVVLGFVAVAGAYLGLADFVAKEIVEFIL